MTGLLVTILALQQFATFLAPVLFALVLVIGFHLLTGRSCAGVRDSRSCAADCR
jgi:hypothetical protein